MLTVQLAKDAVPWGSDCCTQREEQIMEWVPDSSTTRTLALSPVFLLVPKVAIQILI